LAPKKILHPTLTGRVKAGATPKRSMPTGVWLACKSDQDEKALRLWDRKTMCREVGLTYACVWVRVEALGQSRGQKY